VGIRTTFQGKALLVRTRLSNMAIFVLAIDKTKRNNLFPVEVTREPVSWLVFVFRVRTEHE